MHVVVGIRQRDPYRRIGLEGDQAVADQVRLRGIDRQVDNAAGLFVVRLCVLREGQRQPGFVVCGSQLRERAVIDNADLDVLEVHLLAFPEPLGECVEQVERQDVLLVVELDHRHAELSRGFQAGSGTLIGPATPALVCTEAWWANLSIAVRSAAAGQHGDSARGLHR